MKKRSGLGAILEYMMKYKLQLFAGVTTLIITDLFGMCIPWLTKRAIDVLKVGGPLKLVYNFAVFIVACQLIMGGMRYLWRLNLFGLARDVEYTLRNDYFLHLTELEPAFYQKMRMGDIVSRGIHDIKAVWEFVAFCPLIIVDTTTLITGSLTMMFLIDWRLTLLCLSPMPAIIILIHYLGTAVESLTDKAQAKLADISNEVTENFSGIRVIKAYVQEAAQIKKMEKEAKEYVGLNIKMSLLEGAMRPSNFIIWGTSANMFLYFGGKKVMSGSLSIGDLVALNGYLMMLVWPMIGLGWLIWLLRRGIASMDRILEVLDACPAIDDRNADRSIDKIKGEILFDDITFSYDGLREVIKGIYLHIRPGQVIAITGPTGCGKSTLLKLLLRLFEPPQNKLKIDGHDISRIPLQVLRNSIGYVDQDPFIFSDTIAANIAFGRDISEEHIWQAAKIAGLDEDIEAFPGGLKTMLGERGISLSGGQKQRLAIARAVARDPKILLLDDAFSSIDTRTEEKVLKALAAFMKGRTTIIVSHRISTIKNADWIVVMDNGQIREQGMHSDLLEARGLYWSIHQKQQIEQELDAA